MAMTAAHGNLQGIMLQKFASAPRPGAAQMAMTMANWNLPQRICFCAAPRRSAHGNDVAHGNLPVILSACAN
eukprot:9247178-Karenia_brevis.AAC.1